MDGRRRGRLEANGRVGRRRRHHRRPRGFDFLSKGARPALAQTSATERSTVDLIALLRFRSFSGGRTAIFGGPCLISTGMLIGGGLRIKFGRFPMGGFRETLIEEFSNFRGGLHCFGGCVPL